MQKKYFFFDIDGTLTNDNPGGIILPSTLTTIRKLEENGHFVAIATGRSQSMAMEFANQIGIKNLVHDGGNGLTLNGKIVYIHPLDHDWALDIIHECLAKDIPFFVAIDNSYQRYARDHGMEKTDAHLSALLRFMSTQSWILTHCREIHKIFIGLAEGEEDRLVSIHLNGGYMRYEPTQIVIEPGDKVKGIRDMMAYLQAPFEDVVVFGDGKKRCLHDSGSSFIDCDGKRHRRGQASSQLCDEKLSGRWDCLCLSTLWLDRWMGGIGDVPDL